MKAGKAVQAAPASPPAPGLRTLRPHAREALPGRDRLASDIGYPEGRAPEAVAAALDAALTDLAARAQPRAGYLILPPDRFQPGPEGFRIGDMTFRTGPRIAARLRGCATLALFAATAGPESDALAKAAWEAGDPVAAYAIDLAGSALAEGLADRIEAAVAAEAVAAGWGCTNRYSPGYCGWGVAEQHLLFSLFPPRFCGIALTESALMTPIKSVSGILGLGPGTRREEYGCSLCGMENCFRRASRGAREGG